MDCRCGFPNFFPNAFGVVLVSILKATDERFCLLVDVQITWKDKANRTYTMDILCIGHVVAVDVVVCCCLAIEEMDIFQIAGDKNVSYLALVIGSEFRVSESIINDASDDVNHAILLSIMSSLP